MSTTAAETTTTEITAGLRHTGCVKWFNNKAGFGFITMVDASSKDIFVHWSSIKVENSQYKYLVQGEYVEFELVKPEGDKHEFHAVSVSGIKGGNLMCETIRQTREASRIARAERDVSTKPETTTAEPVTATATTTTKKPRRTYRKASGPQSTTPTTNDDGFVKVTRKTHSKKRRDI